MNPCFMLLQGFENSQSSVRKATVVCLVAFYLCVGEELRPYLKELNGSKVHKYFLNFAIEYLFLSRTNMLSFLSRWPRNGSIFFRTLLNFGLSIEND